MLLVKTDHLESVGFDMPFMDVEDTAASYSQEDPTSITRFVDRPHLDSLQWEFDFGTPSFMELNAEDEVDYNSSVKVTATSHSNAVRKTKYCFHQS